MSDNVDGIDPVDSVSKVISVILVNAVNMALSGKFRSQLPAERLVQQRLLQRLQRRELAGAEGGEALGFGLVHLGANPRALQKDWPHPRLEYQSERSLPASARNCPKVLSRFIFRSHILDPPFSIASSAASPPQPLHREETYRPLLVADLDRHG